ncbi:uncharacterized protein LOC112170432 [Rosa chinensis]|uniref:uncharacterized protein LOC112170432 n=1 Tax=Rosa chinensis TaxID=74649 RepID=UPI001AD91C3F|nr:uncharacterized protein LOC112170432 [Rosa chinensis]
MTSHLLEWNPHLSSSSNIHKSLIGSLLSTEVLPDPYDAGFQGGKPWVTGSDCTDVIIGARPEFSLSLSLSSNPKSPTAAFSARKPPPRLTHHQGWQALPHLSSRTALEKPTGALALSVSQNHRTRRVDSDPKTGLRLGPPEAMQVLSNTRRLSRVLKSPIFIFSERLLAPDAPLAEAPRARLQWRKLLTTLSPQPSGITRGCCLSPTEQHSMMISLTERKENHSIDSTRVRRLQSGRSSLGEFVAVASYDSHPWDGEFHQLNTDIVFFRASQPGKRVVVCERGGLSTWSGDSVIYFHR